MSSQVGNVIRALANGAAGRCTTPDVIRELEAHLFSDIVPAGDRGEIPKEAVDVLLDLYMRLADAAGGGADVMSLALDRLTEIPQISEADPVGVIAFALSRLLLGGQVTGRDAMRMARLPWEQAAAVFRGPASTQLTAFTHLLRAVAHEVSEGFADSAAQDADLYREAMSVLKTIETKVAEE